MKRFTLILALVLMVAMPMMAERVTPETARKVAATFLSNNGAKAAQLTDLSKTAGFNNLYIFNAEQGFVVMAADDCVQPILGYSLTGKFVAENMPTNVSGWLQGYNDEIQYVIDNKMNASVENAKLWKDLAEGNSKAAKATIVVDALVQTQWDQDPLYNNLCPYISGEQTVTGCAATAIAQIMKYWEYPTHGNGSHSYNWNGQTLSANFGVTTYDWVNMPLSLNNSSSQTQINAVATLMYHCGVALNMQYGISATGGSSAYPTDIPSVLVNYFNYKSTITTNSKSNYSNSQWITMLKTELNEDRPIQYNGWGANNSGGHSFICDGYDNNNYFHFNWGWSGNNDGFYSLDNLTPGSGGSGGGSYSFTYNQLAIFGIQPKDCLASVPTNLNVVLEGKTSVLTWDAADDAVAYSIYRNGLLIADVTSPTYSDANLSYGTYAYYVKSVDSNGAKSSPTATVTVSVEPIPSNLTVTKDGNNAILNWTEPEWCSPQSDNEVFTYGDATGSSIYSLGVSNLDNFYWGHRYSTSGLINKVIYKVSFYATAIGSFTLNIYKGSSASSSAPQTQIWNQSIEVTSSGWVDIVLPNPIQIDNSKDLWVFMYNQDVMSNPAGGIEYDGNDGNYITSSPTSFVQAWSGFAFLIRTCITDGAFTYNLYDNSTTVAQSLSGSSYTVNNIANNAAHLYTLKTNFNGGLTEASNMAGITLGNASLSSLTMDTNDKMTVTEGSKLIVNGTLSDENATNLVLENGAQLVNSSTGVQATVKKTINPYSQAQGQNNGWNLIASPITESFEPSVANGFLANDYDLYTFDQSQTLEWRNYESQSFDIINKVGYLYANSGTQTLTFAGTLAANVESTPLTYDEDVYFAGFNLIGNPFPCETYIGRSFYVMNSDGSNFIVSSGAIPPCTAVLVQAQNASDNSITFTKTASKANSNIVAQLKTADFKGDRIIDQACLNFNENDNLVKYSFDKNASSLYFPQEGNNFAAVSFAGQSEMPLNFMVKHNGTYTLSFQLENADVNYLHLIDNMTGANIDLLTNKSYTFEAKTSDYTSRFRLVFSNCEDAVDDNETFAYVSNGEIVINKEGTLQIVDMTGRMVVSRSGRIQCVPTTGMTSGVYVLRLINGDKVKTQKIVIE